MSHLFLLFWLILLFKADGLYQVALMFNQGSIILDSGYNQQAYQGLVDAKKRYSPNLLYDYNISVNDANFSQSLFFINDWVNQNYDLIFFLSYTLQDLFTLSAQTYANNSHTRFVLIDQALPAIPPNSQSIIFREDQAGFLVGLLAAKVTKTQIVGVVGGLSIGPVTKYMSGFCNGVKFICPTCIILQQFLLSFDDQTVGGTVAEWMVSNGADIIFAAAGASGNTALTTAATLNTSAGNPVYVLGVDIDQYSTIFNGTANSNRILSSAMKRVDNAIGVVIADMVEGTFQPGAQRVFDAANFAIDYGDCHDSCAVWGNTTKSLLDASFNNLADGILITQVTVDGENLNYLPRDNEWQEIQSPGGYLPSRSGLAVTTNIDGFQGEEFAIFGGVADAGTVGDLWLFRTWVYMLTKMTNKNLIAGTFPVGRSSHTFVTLTPSNIGIMFGGKTASTDETAFLSEVALLVFAVPAVNISSTWIILRNFSVSPPGLIDHTAVSIPGTNQMLVFGGRSFYQVENSLWLFTLGSVQQNFSNSTWQKIITVAQGPQVNRHSAVLIANCMYIYGGVGPSGAPGNWLWRYNVTDGKWLQMASGTVSRSYHAAVVVQNTTNLNGTTILDQLMLVYGGRDNSGNPSSDTWLYNPRTDKWQFHPVLNAEARFRHALLAINNRVYAFAGSHATGSNFTGSNLRDISSFQFNGSFIIILPLPPSSTAKAWRTVIGSLTLIYMVISMVGTAVVIIFRNRVYPLRASSRVLLLFINLGAFLFINIPLKEIAEDSYPCWLYYWLHYLAPPVFMTPILVSVYRHELFYKFSRSQRRWAGCKDLSPAQLTEIKREKHRFRDLILLFWTVLALIPIFVVTGASYGAGHDQYDYSAGNYGCGQGARIGWALGVYFILYLSLLIYGVSRIRNYQEVWSFRLELFYLCLYGGAFGLLFMLFRYTTPLDAKGRDDLAYLFWLIPIFYHFRALFIPSLRTLPIYIALTSSGDTQDSEPLADILATKRGFQYFLYYTAGEFSQENPLCWRAIQAFKLKTTYNAFCDLYTKYFARGAPLEINISHTTLNAVEDIYAHVNEGTPLEELQSAYDVAQMELALLMQEDSYKRFLTSDLYQRYKRNEPLRDFEEDRGPEISRTHANTSLNDVDVTPKLQNGYLEKSAVGRPFLAREEEDIDEDGKVSLRVGKGMTEAEIISRLKEELKSANSRIAELEKLVAAQNRLSIHHSKSLSITGPPSVSQVEELSRISENPRKHSTPGIELTRFDKEDSPSIPSLESGIEHLTLASGHNKHNNNSPSTTSSSSSSSSSSSGGSSEFFLTMPQPTVVTRRSIMDSGLQKP